MRPMLDPKVDLATRSAQRPRRWRGRCCGVWNRYDRARARRLARPLSLRENNARLRAEVRDLKDERAVLASRAEKLEAELERLRATRSVLSKALFGSKSERQSKPRSGRKRGQQPGAVGHGRMQRPELRERTEKRNPPKDARVCSAIRLR